MSEAIVNLVTRDAVELHYQGATYGPVAHTEALAVLLFWLAPDRVRGIGSNREFERAMGELVASARGLCAELEDAQARCEASNAFAAAAPAGFERWVAAAMRSVPQQKVEAFEQRFGEALRRGARGLH